MLDSLWILLAGGGAAALAGGLGWLVLRHREPPPPRPVRQADANTYDPFLEGSAAEQRRANRREGNPVEVHITTVPDDEQPISGWVVDRSMGGLCLMSAAEFAPGATVTVRPAHAPALTPWIDLQVRSCRPGPGGFEVGCQFVKTPPWAILLMFG